MSAIVYRNVSEADIKRKKWLSEAVCDKLHSLMVTIQVAAKYAHNLNGYEIITVRKEDE